MYRKLFKTTIIEKKESLSLKKPFFLINTEIKNEPQITESVPSLPNGKATFVNIKRNIQDIIIKEPESEIIENDLSSSINEENSKNNYPILNNNLVINTKGKPYSLFNL